MYQLCGLSLAARGSVRMLVVGQFAFALSEQAQTLQRASMGDLWMHAGPQHHARALGTMELCCEHSPPPPPPSI